jgi:hypothetical protein
MKIITITLWLCALMMLVGVAFDMLNASNTVENYAGIILLIVLLLISYKAQFGIKILQFINLKTKTNK